MALGICSGTPFHFRLAGWGPKIKVFKKGYRIVFWEWEGLLVLVSCSSLNNQQALMATKEVDGYLCVIYHTLYSYAVVLFCCFNTLIIKTYLPTLQGSASYLYVVPYIQASPIQERDGVQ